MSRIRIRIEDQVNYLLHPWNPRNPRFSVKKSCPLNLLFLLFLFHLLPGSGQAKELETADYADVTDKNQN